ncbi:Hypothetical_protein [Hexamita inflata]|uniref:Hypothetical_protein n=1 Tax=Hexamita inflata TaxID=28002 RepID=A0AA86QKU5_9EUKA|nr:Hypothetical protein HINF_LOCUS49026 [Hexamita inflata]
MLFQIRYESEMQDNIISTFFTVDNLRYQFEIKTLGAIITQKNMYFHAIVIVDTKILKLMLKLNTTNRQIIIVTCFSSKKYLEIVGTSAPLEFVSSACFCRVDCKAVWNRLSFWTQAFRAIFACLPKAL